MTTIESTLATRLQITWKEGEEDSEYWEVAYYPTTIAFDPSVTIQLPNYWLQQIPHPFVAMLANMVAASDCESEEWIRSHPGFEEVYTPRTRHDIFEEVVTLVYGRFGSHTADNTIEKALGAFAF